VYDHPKEPCVSRGNPSTGKLRVCMTTCTGRHLDHRALPPIGLPRWYPKIFPWNRRCGGMIAWVGGEPSPKLSRGKNPWCFALGVVGCLVQRLRVGEGVGACT
jgi:hypothetical protein